MVGLVEMHVMMYIAGDFNGEVGTTESGEEESVGGFGWGTRNRDSRELVELVMRNGLAEAGTFFKKQENPKISYRSGQHKTELDLLVVRRQQMWRVKECKIIAGEHVATQHKPLVFAVRKQKREEKVVGQKTIKWWKWGHSRCIQREVEIRLREPWNNGTKSGRRRVMEKGDHRQEGKSKFGGQKK